MIAIIAFLAALIADALMFYVVGQLFAAAWEGDHGIGAINPVTFIVLVLAAFAVPRLLEYWEVAPARAYAVNGAVMFVAVYGAIRIEFAGDIAIWDFGWAINFARDVGDMPDQAGAAFVGSLLLIGAWIRGAWRAAGEFELETVPRQLAAPFIVVITVAVMGAWTDRLGIIGLGAVAFFAVAIISLAFAQSALSGATIGNLRSGGVTGVLLAATALATLGCVIVFGIVFGMLGRQFGSLAESALYWVLYITLTPLAWLFQLLFGWLLGNVDLSQALDPPSAFVDADEAGERNATERGDGFVAVWRALLLIMAVATIGAIATVILRLYRRGRSRAPEAPASSSAGGLGEDLRNLFRRTRQPQARPPAEGVIALYRQVLDEGERSGRPRESAETPAEYAPALHGLFHTAVTDEITTAFIEARYAGRDTDPARIEELRRRWKESGH